MPVISEEPSMSENANDTMTATLKPSGNLIAAASRDLRNQIQEMVTNGAKNIVFDFSDVTLVDSSGIGVLVGALNLVKKNGGSLQICNASPEVSRLLKLMHLDKHMSVE
ncbi:MAG: anti-sigma factor antagonist [Chitinivibrionales bacterium]|nr:anti-sigma factor antagonist [Chitinivibrionales bacterium]MBD3358252.1 anti-sigma factor antagonist [Chitinivibrionales bacterium]